MCHNFLYHINILFLKKIDLLFLFYVCVFLDVFMSISGDHREQMRISVPRTGVTDGYNPPCGCCEPNPGPL